MPLVAKLRWWLQQTDAKLSRMDHVSGPEVIPPRLRYDEIVAFVRSMDQPDEGARQYLEIHVPRIARTLGLVPKPQGSSRILEMGAYMQMTPALHCVLGYKEVRGAYFGPLGRTDEKSITIGGKEAFRCFVDLFDAEKDKYPYPDGHFETVLACEIFEHLLHDPMHMLLEMNRVLSNGGTLLLTTPNVCSFTAVHGCSNKAATHNSIPNSPIHAANMPIPRSRTFANIHPKNCARRWNPLASMWSCLPK